MRVKLVIGNWKMNGSLVSNRALLAALVPALKPLDRANYAVCAPFPYLAQVRDALQGSAVAWGAQDVSQYGNGAYTGEVSAVMLSEFGCRYAIVGHSERRSLFGETNETVALKFDAALKSGLTPILCVGETLAEREAGVTEATVTAQLNAVVERSGVESLARAVLAYEPVWAIGTGKTATPEQAQATHAYLRAQVAKHSASVAAGLVMLYGGSVKGSNAAQLFAMPDIDGGLIGGASLIADEFTAICAAASAT
ncbi:MAG TPA: triose-phosphate isomerase [Burkholderiales bacterium]|jgi:triosephosphate isomerase